MCEFESGEKMWVDFSPQLDGYVLVQRGPKLQPVNNIRSYNFAISFWFASKEMMVDIFMRLNHNSPVCDNISHKSHTFVTIYHKGPKF